jgi:hypothetical protein
MFPGFFGPHEHIHLPVLTTLSKDTHSTASKAALIGGTGDNFSSFGPQCHGNALLFGIEPARQPARLPWHTSVYVDARLLPVGIHRFPVLGHLGLLL